MKQIFLLTFFYSVFSCILFLNTSAQDLEHELGIWYLEERFIIADMDDDALLNREELTAFPNEFRYYLETENYERTDRNRDGLLSFNEMNRWLNTELSYRQTMEKKEVRALEEKYPLLGNPTEQFLKDRPDLVATLFSNTIWLKSNAELASAIYSDHFWCSDHPEVLLALHKNLLWMASNPFDAKSLYKNRSATRQIPELLGWRADHVDFIRRYPKLQEQYDLQQMLRIIKIKQN